MQDKLIAAHKAGDIDVISSPVKDVADKFDCSVTTVYAAKKVLRELCGRPRTYKYELVLQAHDEGRIDLLRDPIEEMAGVVGVHHDVVKSAIIKSGIKRKVSVRKQNNYHYWWRLRKQLQLTDSWGCIPERVGLTRNEWRKKCALM